MLAMTDQTDTWEAEQYMEKTFIFRITSDRFKDVFQAVQIRIVTLTQCSCFTMGLKKTSTLKN